VVAVAPLGALVVWAVAGITAERVAILKAKTLVPKTLDKLEGFIVKLPLLTGWTKVTIHLTNISTLLNLSSLSGCISKSH
jgi:hypothetical protein